MSSRPFLKMHGLGNDFVVFDAREQPIALTSCQVRAISDRRTGVGCDQLIIVAAGSGPGRVAVRFWNVVPPESPTAEYQPVAAELVQFVAAMTGPYCGSHPVYETNLWFGEHAPHLKSYALIPLRKNDAFGLLLMASENAERFYADMGTVFLTRIGDVFAHCLARHLSLIPAPPSE